MCIVLRTWFVLPCPTELTQYFSIFRVAKKLPHPLSAPPSRWRPRAYAPCCSNPLPLSLIDVSWYKVGGSLIPLSPCFCGLWLCDSSRYFSMAVLFSMVVTRTSKGNICYSVWLISAWSWMTGVRQQGTSWSRVVTWESLSIVCLMYELTLMNRLLPCGIGTSGFWLHCAKLPVIVFWLNAALYRKVRLLPWDFACRLSSVTLLYYDT